MNRYSQRPVLAVVIGAMLALGFAAPAMAREQSEPDDRKEQREQRRAKARAADEQPVQQNDQAPQAERREQQARQQERRDDDVRRNDDQQRIQQQRQERQQQAREQADRSESMVRQQAERREGSIRRDDDRPHNLQQSDGRQLRLPEQHQRRLIEEQRRHAQGYQRRGDAWQALSHQRSHALQQQRRMAQYRYQQDYYQRLRRQQSLWATQRYDYYNDPFFYTPANYRYAFGGQRYETNRYGADVLRQAVRHGYEEGLHAGRADRMDGWRPDYRNAYAYQDANYGYNGYYVRQNAYNHYFRQGFRRGYEDGYYNHYRYGRYNNGSANILPAVLSIILGLQLFN